MFRSSFFFGKLLGIIFGVSPGISFSIFVPLAFSFAQISSPHIFYFGFPLADGFPHSLFKNDRPKLTARAK